MSMPGYKKLTVVTALVLGLTVVQAQDTQLGAGEDWDVYLGDKSSSHYSRLEQINKENVDELEVAWTYNTGDSVERGDVQTNPLIIDGVLYGATTWKRVFALDAATGEEIWRFDPGEVHPDDIVAEDLTRGLVYWANGDDQRLFFSAAHWLYAINLKTGDLIRSFGNNGAIDLRQGLDKDIGESSISLRTPGIIYNNLLIVGSNPGEGSSTVPGHVRAYNVRTGERAWIFHTIPQPGEVGYETWPENAYRYAGAANNWVGFALDQERGIVYVPTGSATNDFIGTDRAGDNLYANSLVALDAQTGERIWHFQAVRHDLLDRDFPAPPNLLTVTHNGEQIDAVAQVTKTGHVFLFDRETGEPLFPIEEHPTPISKLRGEEAALSQPLPMIPAPFARQEFRRQDITDISPEATEYVTELWEKAEQIGIFGPLSLNYGIIFPGFDGGAEWGGAAVDPNSGVLYVNSNEMPWLTRIVEVPEEEEDVYGEAALDGETLYAQNCASCHGADRAGGGGFPSLVDVGDRLERNRVMQIIRNGQGRMPSFASLPETERSAIVDFLFGTQTQPAVADEAESNDEAAGGDEAEGDHSSVEAAPVQQVRELPYTFGGYPRFVDEEGHPAIKPPWGTLNAIDMNTGEYLWKVPLGELPELTARGIPPTGTENYGGPVVTAGGVLFIGATKDEMFRAIDKDTGEILWETKLPFGGYATPATYMVDGKQYVVIAAHGGKMDTPVGDTYVAFALPD